MNRSGSAKSELIVSIALAAVLMGFLVFAFLSMGKKSAKGGNHGIITEMKFTPLAERQVTIGSGGIHARDVAGEYRLTVRVGDGPDAKEYHVFVDPRVYRQHKVGDKYFFVTPPESAASPASSANSPGAPASSPPLNSSASPAPASPTR
jgi:hypothetical protein